MLDAHDFTMSHYLLSSLPYHLILFLIACSFSPSLSQPITPKPINDHSTRFGSIARTHELPPRSLIHAEVHLGAVPYGVKIRPLNFFSPVIAAAGFAESFYTQVMAQALERIEDGAGRFGELRFTRGEVFLSFRGLIKPAVDWEMVYEFAKWMRDRAELGLVGMYKGAIWNEGFMQYVEIFFGTERRD